MLIGINVDGNNRVIAAYPDGDINGDIKVKVSKTIFNKIFNERVPYNHVNGKLTIDKTKQKRELKEKELYELEQELKNTNDIALKVSEYNITGETITEEDNKVLADRKSLRERINALQSEMESLN